jgi:Ca-activated chloride channel family protein
MSGPFDDLDDLKAAMDAATPAPDAARRAENVALAEKNFAARQETANLLRSTSDSPEKGRFRGVIAMIKALTPRQALTATTALVAVGIVAYLPAFQLDQPLPVLHEAETAAAEDAITLEAVRSQAAAPDTMADYAAEPLMELAAPAPPPQMSKRMIAPEGGMTIPFPIQPEADSETYPEAEANPLKVTAEEPVSTFSIDTDTASYSIVRSTLEAGQLPRAEQVRIEEMVNYFPYDYSAPEDDTPFSVSATVAQTPWNADTQLVHIALQGQKPVLDTRPPMNLVFLIDTSGSMNQPDKLPLLKQSFRLLLSQLEPQDQVAIVAYAGSAGEVLEPTPAAERDTILAALERLDAGGSTAGQEGLQQAYATAAAMTEEGDLTRVILATDGDFNVGIHDPDELEDFIAAKRESGAYLSVLGFGRGNLDDAAMQALAQAGNGQAAYIDTLAEAQKTLVDQLSGALFPIANDVKIQVEFNPAQVAEYRLIGYETRALRHEDFNNDKVDAGEIGAGHSVTALYEITPAGSPARLTDPLRYQPEPAASESDELGFLRLRYKEPGGDASQLIETPILPGGTFTAEAQFAAAVAGFGQLLQGSPYLGSWSYHDAIILANAAKGEDPFGYRAQAVQLMRLADSLSR